MKVVQLTIENFRGIESAELKFDGHALLVGANNVGKSTICEALDLVLGPDRLNKFPPIEEYDFYNGRYLNPAKTPEDEPEPIKIRIEVLLTELSAEVQKRCGKHSEFWHIAEKRVLTEGEVKAAAVDVSIPCLRLETVGQYDPAEDEFTAETFYTHSPDALDGVKDSVRREIKRLFGFLYLRALRTGTRALSLERGSLFDVLLRLQKVRTGLWEHAIERLRGLDIEKDAAELEPVLTAIEERLTSYVSASKPGRKTKLFVSQLTREHLRKTMAFFLAMREDQEPVPFQQAGTGTLNTLVLALLSFIAELKPDSVIFAMEEPEIAVQPHTQRRIADYLLLHTKQAFVTSHSPYVIERFTPENTFLLTRAAGGKLETMCVADATGLKENDYKRYARKGLAECMLGKGVVIVEGATESHALPVLARCLEASDSTLNPLDLAGVSVFDAESDGPIPKFAKFFQALGLKTFGFYDAKHRPAIEKAKFAAVLDVNEEHPYKGFEELLSVEVPVARLRAFLQELLDSGIDTTHYKIPTTLPADDTATSLMKPCHHAVVQVRMIVAMKHNLQSLSNNLFRDRLLHCHRIIPAKADEHPILTNPLLNEFYRAGGESNHRRLQSPILQHLDQVLRAIAARLHFPAGNNVRIAGDCFIYQFVAREERKAQSQWQFAAPHHDRVFGMAL